MGDFELAGASPRLDTAAGQDRPGPSPLAGREPDLLTLQRFAGNAAVTRAVTRLVTVQRDPTPPATLTPEQQQQLLRASTTLREAPPLAADVQTDLNRSLAGAPVLGWLEERDAKRAELASKTAELERARDQQAHPPEHGLPPPREQVDALAAEVAALTTQVNQLNDRIRGALGPLGVNDEADLRSLVTNRFPTLFMERAKQIATTELDQNQRIVDQEAQRYGVNACVDPAARTALTTAAADLLAQDARLQQLQAAVDQVRSSVDMPPGGAPDPAQMGSSYPDLLARQEAYNQAVAARNQARDRYALQHPVLHLPNVDLRLLASGDAERIGGYLGGRFTEISNNIRDTKANIASGRLKVWNLRNIVEITSQDLDVTGNPVLEAAVRTRINNEQSEEAAVQVALTALTITAAIVATFATGGVALAAGAVGLAAGAYNASESVRDYLANSAASNVALDPAVAQLTTTDPDLFWLVVDIAGVVFDAVQVVRVFSQMRLAARALKASQDIAGFERAARAALPPDVAERLVATAARGDSRLALMANKMSRLVHTDRAHALHELLEEARAGGIHIASDEDAVKFLDWAAERHGARPESFHAVTMGDVIFVRPQYAENVRVLREELIHVYQQRAGISSADVVQGEIEARLMMIGNRGRWAITNDEVREMIAEVRKMRATGKY